MYILCLNLTKTESQRRFQHENKRKMLKENKPQDENTRLGKVSQRREECDETRSNFGKTETDG
jgi:hypothetical protein